jgi:hypothetical protein
MNKVKNTPAWIEAKKLKYMLSRYLNNPFPTKDTLLKNQIESGILVIMKEISDGYYAKSKGKLNRVLRNFKGLISEFIADIDKLLQQRPGLIQICNRLKEQAKKIEKMERNSLKQLQKYLKPDKNLSLFERLVIYRNGNLPSFKSKSKKFDSEMIKGYKTKSKSFYRVKMRIADITIQIESRFKGEFFIKEDSRWYNNFIYEGTKKCHIVLKVKVVDKLPKLNGAKRLFFTIHPDSNKINWGLYKRNGRYILRTFTPDKKQHIVLNSAFGKGIAYVLPDKEGNLKWKPTDIVYDSLQIILINYLIQRNGVFVHAIGLKDIDNKGVIFIGKAGSGKSTLARLWYKYSRATILNDDRIIIRKIKGSFFIYGSPWHGDFSDYLISKVDSAKPTNLLFIHHKRKNSLKSVSKKEAFNLLYPNLFPTLWDKKGLSKAIIFCQDLIENLPGYSLGFSKDKAVIDFVRRIK